MYECKFSNKQLLFPQYTQ